MGSPVNSRQDLRTPPAADTLVIGGGGFIGVSLVQKLVETGRAVTVLGRSPASTEILPPGVTYVSGDFGQRSLICSLLDKHPEVVHLAYATVPNTSFENPLADLLQNLPPTVQLFTEMAERGGRLVLVSSGGTVYGESARLPIREDHSTRPISPYGVTKLTLENYARLYAVTHGLRFVCVRPANAFGVGQRPFAGQGFVSTAMASAMRGDAIRIFGQKGTIRDYIYVSDLADGIVCALERGRLTKTYNIGTGIGLSNLELIAAMSPLLQDVGCKVVVEHLPERPFDVKQNVLDSSKLREHTGWEAKTSLADGLRLTLDWLRS